MKDIETIIDTVARTIDGEAESGHTLGMTAVACIIANRAAKPRWWGTDLVGVCLAPYQFSCWLAGPDLERVRGLTEANPWFVVARGLAAQVVLGDLRDITGGADSYYARTAEAPSWADSARLTYEDAWHRFYATI